MDEIEELREENEQLRHALAEAVKEIEAVNAPFVSYRSGAMDHLSIPRRRLRQMKVALLNSTPLKGKAQ